MYASFRCNAEARVFLFSGKTNYFSNIGKQITLGLYFLQVEEQVGLDDVKRNIAWDLR